MKAQAQCHLRAGGKKMIHGHSSANLPIEDYFKFGNFFLWEILAGRSRVG
jgi:hypothetical protein